MKEERKSSPIKSSPYKSPAKPSSPGKLSQKSSQADKQSINLQKVPMSKTVAKYDEDEEDEELIRRKSRRVVREDSDVDEEEEVPEVKRSKLKRARPASSHNDSPKPTKRKMIEVKEEPVVVQKSEKVLS